MSEPSSTATLHEALADIKEQIRQIEANLAEDPEGSCSAVIIDLPYARALIAESETGTPVAWVVAVEEQGAMRVYGPQYRSRESAEQDAALPRARGQRAEVWECYVQR